MLAFNPSTWKVINKPTPLAIVSLILFSFLSTFTLQLYRAPETSAQLYLVREMLFEYTEFSSVHSVVSYVLPCFHQTLDSTFFNESPL
jgi:hypothetical protein